VSRSAVLGLAVACWVAAGPAGVWAGGQPAGVLRHRYPNGLTLLARENPAAPVVAVSLQVRMGARWERADEAGVSNLLQRVMVKGTARRSALELAEAAEEIGGSLSAAGDTDYSEIHGAALARHWKELLALVAEVALSPSLPPEEIENERRVILAQIRNRGDLPFPLTFDTLLAALYGPHPYAHPALGRREAVERADRARLLGHYRRHYRGGRMVLAVSGQVSARAVLEEAGRLFAGLPDGDEAVEPLPPPAPPARARQTLERPAAQAQVLLGALAPPLAHPDYAAVKVLSTLLGGGMAGRLFTELRDRRGLAYSLGSIYPSRRDTSFLVLYMGTAPDNLARAEAGLRGEVERVRTERVAPEELARAKAYLLGTLAMDRRTNARQAWYLAFFELAGVGHGFVERYARDVEAVTPEDVHRVARSYLEDPLVTILSPLPR
jgi:zinc protease